MTSSVDVPARRPLRWGILSTARINELILPAARGSPKVEIAAVASRSRERAEEYARTHDIARAHGSYEQLLGDPDIDVVYISLPNALHIEWTIAALRAGKHVLCEKPLSPRPPEVERAFAESAANDRLLMEGYMFRHHPQLNEVATRLVGELGDLRLVRASFSFRADPSADARVLGGPDGGALLDVGCYCVSISRLFGGEPSSVYGDRFPADGVDIRFAATMRFPSGLISQFDCALDLPQREALELVTDEASLVLDDPWAQGRDARLVITRNGESETISLGIVDAYRLELDHFCDVVHGEARPLLTADDAVGNARALEALSRSARERRPVALQPV